MKPALSLVAAALLIALPTACTRAGAAGATYNAAPCKVAPRVDGLDSGSEWSGATRVDIELAMKSGKGAARSARRGELRFMSSSGNLYVAFRLPDPQRDMSMSPLAADAVILTFCRGNEVSPGDDRKGMLPGAYADKHWISAGKDADDAQKDGRGAMEWRKTDAGGEYFMEWQVPLRSGDKNDISAAPGDRLRFNLIYIDRFGADLDRAEIGGVFGPDTDHVNGWGTIALAEGVGAEAPAPAPTWLAALFPHTGARDRLASRLRRLDATEFQVGAQTAGSVIVELKYPGLDGRDEMGKARIFLPPSLRAESKVRVPLVHAAGYETNEAAVAGLLALGYAVSTPHANPLNPLGRGVNLDRAILHAARALPCIDPLRVSIQGGSAGGWMTLMLTADAFPLVWSMPDVPPIHWGYNAAFIGDNQVHAAAAPGATQLRLPILAAVGGIVQQARTLYGVPFESPAYLATSPLAHLDTITAPTLTVFSTADLLVPINQVGPKLVKPHDPKLFPEGFHIAMTDRFPAVDGKRTLLEALPSPRYELFEIPPPENPVRPGAQGAAKAVSLPFSKERTWSIVVLDEGAPEPMVGHFKYQWGLDHEPFRKWAESQGVTPDQLTAPKLQRLMKRMAGEPWRPFRARPGSKGDEVPGNVLDYPEAERADVLLGLTSFAADDARALRLALLYGALPADLKRVGPRLGDGTAGGVRKALASVK
jgi:hypothetical protein